MEHKKMTKAEIKERNLKAELFDFIAWKDENIYTMDEVVDLLEMEDKGVDRTFLYKFLREHSVLKKDNMPVDYYWHRGYFAIITDNLMAEETKVIVKKLRVRTIGLALIYKLMDDYFKK